MVCVLSLAAGSVAQAQVTLEMCREMARRHYPQIRQYRLIELTRDYNLENANRGYLPQPSLSARATRQSAVTALPISIPGIEIPGIRKDQYQAVVEVNQTLWDGGGIHAQKEAYRAAAESELRQLAVDLYALNGRVDQLFFGILLLDAQLAQNALLLEELQRNFTLVEAYLANGVANRADLDAVRVNQLTAMQNRTQMGSTRKAYREMLSAMIGEPLGEERRLVKPDGSLPAALEIRRPELLFFDAQNGKLDAQERMIKAKNMPRLGVYVQGGYGNPGLNMLKNKFEFYYIAGVRLSWNFGSFYTKKNEYRQIDAGRKNVDIQRETFLYNTNLQVTMADNNIARLREQMKKDDEIIALRVNIRLSAQAKAANGTMTILDMLREVNNEDMARQNKILHELQLLQAIWDLKNTTNNILHKTGR